MAASKNRGKKSRSSKPGGKHLSGNPATRAAEERQHHMAAFFGTFDPEARSWWDSSAADLIDHAHGLTAVDGVLPLEDAVSHLLGEELARRAEQEHRGFDLPEWLSTVADHAVERLRDDSDPASWLLLHAFTTMGTDRAAKTAKAELANLKRAASTAEFAARYPWAAQASPARPTGRALCTADDYGSRYLLVAPFQTPGDGATAHWYAWDVDLCDTQRVVAAAPFSDPDDALADWRAAVGVDVTTNSLLSPAEPATIRDLLDDCLLREMLGGSLMGDETVDLLSEHFRMRSRAHQLSRSLPGHRSNPHASAAWRANAHANGDHVLDEFGDWFRDRHSTDEFDEELAATLIIEWLGTGPGFAQFSCSPHRIRAMTSFIWDSYDDETAAGIRTLLPDWVSWCAEKTGLSSTLTDRSLAEAGRSAAASRSTHDIHQTAPPRIAE